MADDFGSTPTTTVRIPTDGTITGKFEDNGDADWFRVTLQGGVTYYFELLGAAEGGGSFSDTSKTASLSLRDSAGDYIGASNYQGPLALQFTPRTTGDYIVDARGGTNPGSYTLRSSAVEHDDFANDTSTTGRLDLGVPANGKLGTAVDRDWFKVTLNAGELYTFKLLGHDASTGPVSLNLFDERGLSYASVLRGDDGQLSVIPRGPGAYYLEVLSGGGTGNYTVVAEKAVDDFTSAPGTAGRLGLDAPSTGVINMPGDSDWFAMTLDADHAYTFTVRSNDGGASAGTLHWSVAGTTVPGGVPFAPDKTGTYYLQVDGSVAQSYTVTAALVPDDHGNTPASAAPLALGASVGGMSEYRDDSDWYALSLEAGKYYAVSLQGNGPAAVAATVVDSNGQEVYLGSNAFFAESSGTYRIKVAPVKPVWLPGYPDPYATPFSAQSYALQVTPGHGDDVGDTIATAQPLALGVQAAAALQTVSDRDVFKLTLTAGTNYVIKTGGALGAPFLSYSGPGVSTKPLEAAPDGQYWISPSASGDYYVTVSRPGLTGDYTLLATLAPDDYAANTGTSGRLEVGGRVTSELGGYGIDADWFAIQLTAGQTYWLGLDGAGATPLALGELTLRDSQGKAVSTSGLLANGFILPYSPAATGTYYLDVHSDASFKGRYSVSARVGEADDVGATPVTARAVAVGETVHGKLEIVNDVDMFKVHLEAGSTYVLHTSGVNPSDGSVSSNPDYHLRAQTVVDGVANYVTLGAGGIFKPTLSGDYYISVANFASANMGELNWGAYSMSIDLGVPDDHGENYATASRLLPGRAVSGNFEYAHDTDALKLAVHAGVVYHVQIDLSAAGNTAGTVFLEDTTHQLVRNTALSNGTTQFDYTAQADGDVLFSFLHNTGALGSFTVKVDAVIPGGDAVAPSLVDIAPANGAVGVGAHPHITLNFDEPVNVGVGSILVKNAAGEVVQSIDVGSAGVSVAGSTLTFVPQGALLPGTSYRVELPQSAVIDVAGNPFAGGAWAFSTAAGAATPTAGDDLLTLGGSATAIDGGAGVDTLLLAGAKSDYSFTRAGNDVVMRKLAAPAQAFTLTNVERVQFERSAEAIGLDEHGAGGQAFRLYQAAFNRAPDQVGLGFWMNALDKGVSLHDVATEFVSSAEFLSRYGYISNADFVDRLYQNVLHRAGEQSGFDFWVNALEHGVARADILVEFSESAENQAAMVGLIGNGFEYKPFV